MKLYTEEQVRDILKLARLNSQVYTDDYLIESLTPIELPTDDEIENRYEPKTIYDLCYLDGAKWMRDKIQGGNK